MSNPQGFPIIYTTFCVQIGIMAWQNHGNNKEDSMNWQFTTKESKVKSRKLYPSIDN